MRTATLILAAVLSTVAFGSRGYCAEAAPGASRWAESGAVPGTHAAPMLLAGDSAAPEVGTADRLGNGLPANGSTAEIPAADNQPDPLEASPAQDQTSPNMRRWSISMNP